MASLPDHLMPAPVGTERLPREILAEHQRDRVMDAAAGAFATRGYRATTVDDIVTAARIGVGGFYDLFSGKEECFLALYDRVVAEARERIVAAAPAGAPWAERARAGLRRLLELAAAEPDRARVAIVEARAAGPAAEERHARTVAELVAFLREGRAAVGEAEGPPPRFEEAVVPGLAWILQRRLADGGPLSVEELLPDVEELVLTPYGGPAAPAA